MKECAGIVRRSSRLALKNPDIKPLGVRNVPPTMRKGALSEGADLKENVKGRSKTMVGAGPSRELEKRMWERGFARVAGVDEAGRGPLAGPVVAAACVLPVDISIEGINDSKAMTETNRENIYETLTSHPEIEWAVAVSSVEEIDSINILQATLKAMVASVRSLPKGLPDYTLIDGNRLPKELDSTSSQTVVKGDAKSVVIAAASIIAKVTRDRLMMGLHKDHPQYGFDQHKGYGVPAHIAAIRTHGPSPVHRRSFAPVKHWWPKESAQGKPS